MSPPAVWFLGARRCAVQVSWGCVIQPIPMTPSKGDFCYFLFMEEENKAQRGWLTHITQLENNLV